MVPIAGTTTPSTLVVMVKNVAPAMTFREYLRWEGAVAITIGIGLCVFGTLAGHQGRADALISGMIMLGGTGAFLALRHRIPFRRPATWFTLKPIATAQRRAPARARRALLGAVAVEAAVTVAVTVGLSYLTGFWLTYVDFGVWAIAVGVIKAGPSITAIRIHEMDNGVVYRVARRPLRGIVALTADGLMSPDT